MPTLTWPQIRARRLTRHHLLAPAPDPTAAVAAERALAPTQAGNFPVLLIDGMTAGVWHQRRAGTKIAITVEPLRPLSGKHRRALAAAAERIGMIGEGRAELTVGPVGVGAHA